MPGFNVITRASAAASVNARLAMMDFPKAAVIGLIGDANAVPHDYMLDGLDLPSRLRVQAEIEAKRRAGATVLIGSTILSRFASLADEIWWFADGSVRLKGDPDEVLRAYQREALQALREACPKSLVRSAGEMAVHD